MKLQIRFRLNGKEQELFAEPNLTLLDLLRERLQVTSPKRSCEEGEYGPGRRHGSQLLPDAWGER